MSRRPTARALVVAAIATLLFVAGSTAQAGWLYVLAAGALGLIASSALARHRLSSCSVTRTLPATIRAGDEVEVELAVRNDGRARIPLLRLEDEFDAVAPASVVCEPLAAGAQGCVRLPRRALRRGVFSGRDVVTSCGWPFGLFRSQRVVEVASPVVVVPRHVELATFPILEPSSFPAEALHERARTGAGLDYLGVREYRAGDAARAVHWRSSARAGRLVVREYEEETHSRVCVLLAGGDDGVPPDSSFEALASAAASVALYALVTGHPVDLVGGGGDGEPECMSGADRAGALRWLAEAKPRDVSPTRLVAPAIERVGRRGTVVLLSPTGGTAGAGLVQALQAIQTAGCRAIPVVALSSSWASPPTPPSPGEDSLLGRLGARTSVRIVSKGRPLKGCLES